MGPDERTTVARPVVLAASLAFAFMHGGMWAHEELSGVFCPRCRRISTAVAAGVSVLILAVALFFAVYWLRGPR